MMPIVRAALAGLLAQCAALGCTADTPDSDCARGWQGVPCCCGAAFGTALCSAQDRPGRCVCPELPDASAPLDDPDPPGDGRLDLAIAWRWLPRVPTDGSGEVAGLDLDGHDTSIEFDPVGCGYYDGTFGERRGVDNNFAWFMPQAAAVGAAVDERVPGDAVATVNVATQQLTSSGAEVLVLRLGGIGDTRDDGRVDAAVYRGSTPPELDEPIIERIVHVGETITALAPGQTLVVDPSPLVVFARARLSGGQLEAEGGDLPLRLVGSSGREGSITLRDVRLVADLQSGELRNGILAGGVSPAGVLRALAVYGLNPEPEADTAVLWWFAIVAGAADLLPAGATCSPELRCTRMSAAFEFGAVAADVR